MFSATVKRSLLVVMCSATLTLAACSKKEEEPAKAEADMMAATALEGALDIVAWPGYIESGQSDKAYDWVSQFEAQTGCKVTVKTAGTSDEMVSLMASGGPQPSPPGDASWPPPGNAPYDLVTASGDASLRLIRGGTVQPVSIERIPSYSSIDERLQKAAWHYVDGKHYGVPYQWGPNVLLYNTETFKKPPTSWSVVFEPQKLPDGKPNKGRVQAYDGAIYIADAALYLKTKKPELSIKDPYELNETQYSAVLELLRGQHPLDPALLARRQRAGPGLPERRHRGLGLVALPGEHAAHEQGEGRQHRACRRRDRVGGHHHARHRRQTSELRLQMARVVDLAQGAR